MRPPTTLLTTLALLAAPHAHAADTTANAGPLTYTGTVTAGDLVGTPITFRLQLQNGDLTGTVTGGDALGLSGPIAKGSYWENGRCIVRVPGPSRTTYEFYGRCTTDAYTGSFTRSGPNFITGDFKAAGTNTAKAPAPLTVPTTKLTCAYMLYKGPNEPQELRFSNMGALTLRANGTYLAGTGVTGRWKREGNTVRLIGGAWNDRTATLELDRSGKTKLVFRSVDPDITSCTQGR
ncbi:hypothetical protein [Deinococcus maricopensis]|uniref:Uncharacterized protein n=1 Tax=Deinococcus maricopensis (strain DSM 21211 / LMG 22137 / NRRL B-23946 / LB-34) TaxID=709986 RepID=E8U5P1_DEIML|nr:hypothetical protein [Deinococcus maricopensis]ADV66380.1 hypothetical protein Deima_0724 [Deinococcus maricopensis DSM 21211]